VPITGAPSVLSFLVGDSVVIALIKCVCLMVKAGLKVTGVSLALRNRIGLNANIQLPLSMFVRFNGWGTKERQPSRGEESLGVCKIFQRCRHYAILGNFRILTALQPVLSCWRAADEDACWC
jgi:hypothetical protein